MKLEYIDKRPMVFFIGKGEINLPNKENIIEVDDKEGQRLLKMKNGKNPVFRQIRRKIAEENNGNR